MPQSNMDRRFFLRNSGITAFSWGALVGLLPAGLPSRLVAAASSVDGENSNLSTEPAAHAGSKPIHAVKVGKAAPLPDNGGDTWVAAWADDDNLYSPSDDTGGFHKAANANIAFNRITGNDPLHLSGSTVNPMVDYGKGGERGPDGCTWKSSGCTCLDGVLYWVVARHSTARRVAILTAVRPAQNASIIKSTDLGRTWSRPVRENYQRPMFPGRRFAAPYFVEYGRSRADVDNSGQYVYALSNNGFWDCGDDMVLGRVSAVEDCFPGWSGLGVLHGRRRDAPILLELGISDEAKPVIRQAGKLGMTGAVYLPAHRRYLMIGWYYPAGGGKMKDAATHTVWDFYEAPRPWGPWTPIGSHESSPQGYYSPEICPKFQTQKQSFRVYGGKLEQPGSLSADRLPAGTEFIKRYR